MVVVPSLKVTVPAIAPLVGDVTVAVNVTLCPTRTDSPMM